MPSSRSITAEQVAVSAPLARSLDWTAAARANAVWIVAFFAIIASITSITNGFALDDLHIIFENGRVHSLANIPHLFVETYWPPIEGASLYRPLTMVAFTLEWVFGGGSPLPFHIVNIVLYALVCVAFYRVLRMITDANVALLAASLFAVHPVHTEAVANSVGQAELLVALFLFLAVARYIDARWRGALSWRDVGVISACYLAGCLSKEHALILPGLLVSSEVLIHNEDETFRARIRRVMPVVVILSVVAVAFMLVRTNVVGALRAGGNNELLGGQPFGPRALTMLNVATEWLRLLVFPARLSASYSYPQLKLATGFEPTMIPGLLVIAAATVLALRYRAEKPVVTFSILWIAVTMAIPSNLIMVTGFVLAERTLFLASGAAMLLAAVAFFEAWRRAGDDNARSVLQTVAALALVLGATRSATRNPVWKDNEAVFTNTVDDSPFSYRAHWMLAEHYAMTGRAQKGAEEMFMAIALGPKKSVGLVSFGAEQLARGGMCRRALPLFRRALTLAPHDAALRHDAGQCLRLIGRVDLAVPVEQGSRIP
jgi:hypothetical protein